MPPNNTHSARSSSRPQVTLYGGNRANFISSWLFFWVFNLLVVSRRHNLDSDNFSLRNSEEAGVVGDKLEKSWNEERKNEEKRKPAIRRALVKSFGTSYALLGFYKLFSAVFIFIGSYYLVNRLIVFTERRNDPDSNMSELSGYMYALGLFLSAVLSSIFTNQLIAECARMGVQVRAALMVLVYRKSLRLSSVRSGNSDVVNLISHDCNRIAEACVNFHFLWSSAVEVIAIIVLAWVQLGVAAVPALVILIILFFVQYKLGRLTSSISNSMASITMQRINLMSEILTAIKLIKFYAWEVYFRDRVLRVRRKEMSQLLTSLKVKVWSFCIVFGAPTFVMLGCLCVKDLAYTNDGGVKASTIFTVLSLFNTLRYPLIMLPTAVRTTFGAVGSFNRLDKFLLQPELEPFKQEDELDNDPDLQILIENADFAYDECPDPTLRFLTMRVKKGEVIAIVGDVGAGKSSVLAAILGQIRKVDGTRLIRGSMSYVPHDPWLLNATLRENILFGNVYDPKRYREVLQVCQVTRDLPLLSYEDMTEIGERGVNLSLGQRQRVSLARAVYSDADIVLLDDPLSTMDPVVGKHIFHECIRSYLRDKAVIYVTNQLQFLSECDRIMVMKNGTCDVEGTHDELQKNVDLASLINEYMEIEDPDQIDELISEIRLEPITSEDDDNELEAVFISDGKSAPVSRNNTIQFGSPETTGANEQTISRIVTLNAHTIQNANINEHTISKIIEQRNLTVLSGAGKTRMMGNKMNRELNVTAKAIERNQLTIHSLNDREGITSSIEPKKTSDAEVEWVIYFEYLRKATGLTGSLVIIALFFIVHSIRIFSDWWLEKSVAVTDTSYYGDVLGVYGALVGAFGLGVYIRGVAFAWAIINKSHSLHDRTLKKILRAPMSYFDLTPIGRILTLFAKHQIFVDEILSDNAFQFLSFLPVVLGTVIFVMVLIPWTIIPGVILGVLVWVLIHFSSDLEDRLNLLDTMTKAPIFSHLAATLDGLASIRVYNAQLRFDEQNRDKIDANNKALFGLMQLNSWLALYIDLLGSLFIFVTALLVVRLDENDASVAGLALSNALQVLILGQWMIRRGRDVMSTMNSVQQLLHYRNNIQTESDDDRQPQPEWGSRGEIEFKQVTLRYNAYGVAVLKKVSFHILPREKIGIVGKTGSGKSTLLVSLLRIVELFEGEILIDSMDISTIGLRYLRSKIAIIPQEPVIFAGTIRSNLDPFDKCAEEEIWSAVKAVHLEDKVKSMPDKLDTPVLENGKNFSFGQRQLLCIARALLKKTRILVLDEATSAVDSQTDNLIQETIKKNFADHTVLTIAHRLNTIMEAERILCLNEGRVIEFDTPLRLLENTDGFFYQLIACNGPEAAERLKQIALQHSTTLPSISQFDAQSRMTSTVVATNEPSNIQNNSTNISTQPNSTNTTDNVSNTSPPAPSGQHSHMPHSFKEVFAPH